jgi:hypothetical protein
LTVFQFFLNIFLTLVICSTLIGEETSSFGDNTRTSGEVLDETCLEGTCGGCATAAGSGVENKLEYSTLDSVLGFSDSAWTDSEENFETIVLNLFSMTVSKCEVSSDFKEEICSTNLSEILFIKST